MGVTVLLFEAELQKERTASILSEDKMACMWKGEESIKNSFFIEFISRYHS